MPGVLGIETEYGILAPGAPDSDPAVLSAAVVNAWPGAGTRHDLDVPDEVPIADLNNRVLGNGARFYVDHAHPEYSSPEVTSPLDAVVWDAAGESIVLQSARLASEALGTPVRIFKNNTDSHGSSYGCHENYLLHRSTPWARIVEQFTAFLVSRSVVVGAGRVGIGRYGERPGYQLSQRADFFETTEGIETTRRRPVINTRDEPHAPARLWRRLHVITGDANRSPWSTWLKVGTAGLVLDALEAGALPAVRLAAPVRAMASISHDPSLTTLVELDTGAAMTALDVQRVYFDAVLAKAGRDGVAPDSPTGVLIGEWGRVLDDLAADPDTCADRLDWVAKLQLLETYSARHGLPPASPRFAQLDLAWAELGEGSAFEVMLRAGRFRDLPDAVAPGGGWQERVRRAVEQPPPDTRAWLRGTIVQRAADAVEAASWDWMMVRNARGRRLRVDLSDPLDPGTGRLDEVMRALAG